MNTDAAIFEKENRFGLQGIIRDHNSHFVAAISGLKEGIVRAEIAEAIALKEVLSWIKEANLIVQQVETDSLVLVQAIKSTTGMTFAFGGVVEDCKQLLASFNNVSLDFVKRPANRVAHYIARASQLHADCIFLESNVPAGVLSVVRNDLI